MIAKDSGPQNFEEHHLPNFLLSFSDWPRENVEMVTSYLEDQLFSLLYLHVFQPNSDLDRQRDELYSAHLSRLSEGLTPTHPSLQISLVSHVSVM
jgi:hypothetical protein